MKIDEIIESLCAHKISKYEAISQIRKITNELRKGAALEFVVESCAFSVEDNHGYLNLILPYQYSKIKGKVAKGDKVDVVLIP